MSSVDNRIVNMTFNNKDFERNATQSTKTLENLEKTIANTGKGGGLETFGNGVDTVKTKFSAMQVIGVTALATIASKAVSAGLNIVKSLTIAPLVQGFQEYQTNLNSIQTVVSNTGESVDTVNKYMQKLNKYSDQTIYNFSEMAKNIGTFTAAGVDLDTATDSIKGIANLAALSGSSSQQASTAMYQLSQAISAGRVGLQDWNSVVNAGMGGKIFQTALSRTAVNMGKLTEGAAVLNKETGQLTVNGESFRQSISAVGGGSSWLDGVALTETLKQISGAYSEAELKAKGYTDAQVKDIVKLANTAFNAATKIKTAPQLLQVVQESVGSIFANSFSLILGDFKQSKKLWTSIGATIVGPFGILTKIGNGVTDTLKGWVKLGGRNKMLDGFERAFKNIWRLIVPLKNAFRDLFPSDGVSGASRLNAFSKAFKDFAEFLKPSVKTMHQLRDIFGGVFAVLHIGWTIVKGIAGAFGALFSAIFENAGGGRDGILGIVAAVGRSLIAFDKFITAGGKFEEILKSVGEIAGSILGPIIAIAGQGAAAISGLFSGFGAGGLDSSIAQIKKSILDMVYGALRGLETLTAPFESLSGFIGGLADKISGVRRMFSFENQDLLNTDALTGGFDKIEGAATSVSDKVSGGFDKISGATDKAKESVTGMFDAVSGSSGQAATATTDKLSGATETATDGLSRLKELLSNVAEGIGNAFSHLGDTFAWVQKQFSDLFGNFDGMDWVAFFNAIFSGALILTLKNFAKNTGGIISAIRDTFGELQNTLKSMQQAIKARAIRDIAIAVALLAASMLLLSLLDVKTLGKSLGAVAGIMAILVGALKAMAGITTGNMDILALSTSLTLMSFAMLQLAIAVSVLGRMDMDELARGLGGMGIALGLMVGAIKTMSGIEGSLKSAAFGIVLMAGAMVILAGAVLAFGKMSLKTLAKGLGAMAIAINLMVGSMMALALIGPGVAQIGGAILLVAGAMVLMAVAVGRMGKLDLLTLAKGLGAMAITLALVVGAVLLLAGAGPAALYGAGAILLIALALEKIAVVIALLGLLPFKVLATGLAVVAIALAILLAAGAVAMVVAPGLIALGIAVGLLGAGMLLAGAGMALFGAGFAVLVAAGVAGVAVLTAAFHAFLAVLPTLAVQLVASIVAFLKALANAAPKIRKSLGTIIKEMLRTVRDAIPELGSTFSALINEAIRILQDSVPRFITMAFTIITAFLDELDKNIGGIVETASSIIQKFMNQLGKEAPDLADAGIKMLIDMINGMADAVNNNSGGLLDAIGNLASAIGNAIKDALGKILGSIDIGALLPDFDPGAWIGNKFGRSAASGRAADPWEILANTIKEAAGSVRSVMDETIKFILSQDYPTAIVNAALGVQSGQLLADNMAARADTLEKSASFAEQKAEKAKEKRDKLRDIAKKKKATAKQKKEAEDAQEALDKAQRDAQKKRARADIQPSIAAKQQMLVDKKTADLGTAKDVFDAVKEGNFEQAGDLKADQAADLAQRAKDMLAKSQADQKLAEKLAKGNKKERELAAKMREQAQKEADAANAWAAEARQAMIDATAFYKKAAQARMDEVIAQHEAAATALAEQKQALIDQAAYDKADTAGKAAIMAAKAKASQDKADAQEAIYQQQLLLAEQAIAAGNFDAANAHLDAAEAASAIAAEAASDAADQAAQAAQLAEQAAQEATQATASGGTGGANNIQAPSRTALEDAAKSVDRYTQSLAEAEVAAGAGQPGVTFTQVNTSPVALTASEIYRQTNNLLSLAQAKTP